MRCIKIAVIHVCVLYPLFKCQRDSIMDARVKSFHAVSSEAL